MLSCLSVLARCSSGQQTHMLPGYSVQPGEGCLPWYKQQVRVLQTEVKEHEKYAKKKNKEHGLLVDRIEQLEAQLKSAQAGSYT